MPRLAMTADADAAASPLPCAEPLILSALDIGGPAVAAGVGAGSAAFPTLPTRGM
jgi:hypothetical protein